MLYFVFKNIKMNQYMNLGVTSYPSGPQHVMTSQVVIKRNIYIELNINLFVYY